MELEKLKSMGALANSLEVVPMNGVGCISIDSLQRLSDDEQCSNTKVVTLSNPVWLATSKRMAPQDATRVYSGDANGLVGCWQKDKKTFLFMRLVDNRLATVKTFIIKGEKKMAGLDTKAMDAFSQSAADFMNEGTNAAAAATASKSTDEKKASSADLMREKITSIRSVCQSSIIANTDELIVNNRKLGKLIGYITKTNAVVKVAKKSSPKLDSNKNRIPLDDTPDDIRKKHESDKKYPLSWCVKESSIEFRHAKPTGICGVIIATPANTEASITSLNRDDVLTAKEGSADLVYRIMPLESSFVYLAANYGDMINEDPAVCGAEAGKVSVKHTASVTTDETTGATIKKIKNSLVLVKDSTSRKTLLTETNYFPAKIYKTLPVKGASAEDKAIFNLNIEALLKNDEVYNSLSEEAKKDVVRKQDGSLDTAWFDHDKAITVKKFTATSDEDVITNVELPVRVKKPSKGKSGYTYSFEYVKIGEENGPETIPVYKNLIEKSHIDNEAFLRKVGELSASTRSKGSRDQLSYADFLRASFSSTVDTGVNKTLADLAEEIESLN